MKHYLEGQLHEVLRWHLDHLARVSLVLLHCALHVSVLQVFGREHGGHVDQLGHRVGVLRLHECRMSLHQLVVRWFLMRRRQLHCHLAEYTEIIEVDGEFEGCSAEVLGEAAGLGELQHYCDESFQVGRSYHDVLVLLYDVIREEYFEIIDKLNELALLLPSRCVFVILFQLVEYLVNLLLSQVAVTLSRVNIGPEDLGNERSEHILVDFLGILV